MFRKMLAVLYLCLYAGFASAAESIPKMLIVHQSFADGVNTARAFIARPAGARGSLEMSRAGENISDAGSLAGVPLRNYAESLSEQSIVADLEQRLHTASFTNIQKFMTRQGIATGLLQVEQTLRRPGGETKVLVATVTLQGAGQVFYSTPRIVANQAEMLYVVYTPRKVAGDLPASWAYPNAGTLQYQKRDLSWNVLSAWQTVDVSGAYDAPEDYSGAVIDPDAGLKCLINKASSATCPQAYPDVMALLRDSGTAFVIVDYIRTLAPVYDQRADGTEVARASVSVDTRTLSVSCGTEASLKNSGRIGFLLDKHSDRYLVMSNSFYTQLGSTSAQEISPTQTFNKAAPVPSEADYGRYGNIVVNPFGTGTEVFDYTNDTVNGLPASAYIYVAAIDMSGDVGEPLSSVYWRTSGDWRNGRHTSVQTLCDPVNKRFSFIAGFNIGGVAGNTNNPAGGFIVPVWATFTRGTAGSAYFETREDSQWQACGGNAYYDGGRSITFRRAATYCTYGSEMWQYMANVAMPACPAGSSYSSDTYYVDRGGRLGTATYVGWCIAPGRSVRGQYLCQSGVPGYKRSGRVIENVCVVEDPAYRIAW